MSKDDKNPIIPVLDWKKNPMGPAFEGEGITPEYLARKLKSELNARETKAQIPKGATEFAYSKSMTAWDVRQKARQDAHKFMGDYPAEKVEHSGKLTLEEAVKKLENEDG